MTIAQLVQIGKDLDAAFEPLEKLEAYQTPPSVLPAGCPLYASVELAGKIFSISPQTVRRLVAAYCDFPSVRIGGKIVIDVPGAYKWLSMRNGGKVEMEEFRI